KPRSVNSSRYARLTRLGGQTGFERIQTSRLGDLPCCFLDVLREKRLSGRRGGHSYAPLPPAWAPSPPSPFPLPLGGEGRVRGAASRNRSDGRRRSSPSPWTWR